MSDLNLLTVGIFVFGLMFIGMVLTIAEFRQLSKNDSSEAGPNGTRDMHASKRKQ